MKQNEATATLDTSAFLELIHINYSEAIKRKFRGFLNQHRQFMDASQDAEDLYGSMIEGLVRHPKHITSFQEPLRTKTGKLIPIKDRLLLFAQRHATNYLKKIHRRFELIQVDPYSRTGRYCEAFTPLEIASMRASELGDGELPAYERHEDAN